MTAAPRNHSRSVLAAFANEFHKQRRIAVTHGCLLTPLLIHAVSEHSVVNTSSSQTYEMTNAPSSIHFNPTQLFARSSGRMGDIMRRAAQLAEPAYEEVQMEGRIARLESDVAHIQKDVADIKADVKGLRDKVEAGFTDIRESIAQLTVAMEKAYGNARVATIETRVWGLVTLGGILFLMARAFKWI